MEIQGFLTKSYPIKLYMTICVLLLFWFAACFLWAVNLCSNPEDKLQIYRDNFEKAYMDSTERFYRTQAPSYLQQNGVQNYMKYVSGSAVQYVP